MARVRVLQSSTSGGKLTGMTVEMDRLGQRQLDRDTIVKWMKDGHTFIPVVGGKEQRALHLVEGPDDALYVRTDGASVAEDLV